MKEKKDKSKQKSAPEIADEEVLARQEDPEPLELVSLDVGEEGEETPGLDEETTLDLLRQAREEAYREEIGEYTRDKAVEESLAARQELDTGGEQLGKRLQEHHATSPDLSGGDLDAAWDKANVGDETIGGTAATPDQDRIDAFGEAYGISYEDDEPLNTGEKLTERDRQRWELDPDSAEEESS